MCGDGNPFEGLMDAHDSFVTFVSELENVEYKTWGVRIRIIPCTAVNLDIG